MREHYVPVKFMHMRGKITGQFTWLQPVLLVIGLGLAITTGSRVALLIWLHARVEMVGTEHLPFIFIQGLRFDILTLGLWLGIPVTLTPLAIVNRRLTPAWMRLLGLWCIAVIAIMLFMEIATPSFINEYDAKPDRRFLEYLIYPREVFATLWGAYKLQLLIAAFAVAATVKAGSRFLLPRFVAIGPIASWAPLLLVPLLAFATLAAIRSTTDHRPVNPSTVVFSEDPLANEFSLNSSYTALYAAYELSREDRKFAYESVTPTEAVAAIRESMRIDPDRFTAGPDSTDHLQPATRHTGRPPNLVIILEESLGAEFVGALGGLPLTPELDRLQNDGIWFENLYATGTRSVRGIEAVISGFPPTPSRSVVKLPRAQRDFFTLAALLKKRGYSTSFLYGGEPQFDNMGRFFANNGFQSIVGRHDFGDDVFDGAWGASDEDLFRLANKKFSAQPTDKPFFSLVFTTSNHSPWDFPANRIELYESPAATRNNAVKYADYAFGKFIRTARTSAYWDNTIFLVIADHCSRVYGAELVPIERFHIPGLILGGSITPTRISRIASQLDMLPTLLSLMGIDSEHPAIGIDQTRTDLAGFPGRAIMQYGGNQAYMQGQQVVILQKGRPPGEYAYRDSKLTPVPGDPVFMRKVLAMANWPWQVYRAGSYRLPAGSS